MRGLLIAGVVIVALSSGVMAGGTDPAGAVSASGCKRGAVAALVGGKHLCLRVGQSCRPARDAAYHRYGFHCHATGRLTRKQPAPPAPPPAPVRVSVAGPPQVVFDWTTDRCDEADVPDLSARAFRDASGQVHLIAAHYVTRLSSGPDLNHLHHDCRVVFDSHHNADPAAFDDAEWIGATYTPDGNTVYALVHSEYHGWEHPDQCHSADASLRCWWNTLTSAVSTDGGRTFSHATPPGLVATVPYRYVPDSGTYGTMMPTNIVRNDRDGYYYALVYVKLQPATGDNDNRDCLIRTRNLADPSSWRAWSGGTSFSTTFVDPYRSSEPPADHLCQGVSREELGELPLGSLTYVPSARQWLLIGVAAGGFYYSTSTDLIHWAYKTLFLPATVGWTYQCGGPDPVHYPSLLDPASASRNFETSGRTAYLYYTQFHTESCSQGLDRDLVRVPVTIGP